MKGESTVKKNQKYLKSYILCFFALSLILCSTTAFGATIYVPGDYSTIQAAIDTANPGDTILVADGTYNENVTVDKQLVIKSVNGYSATTVVGRQYCFDHVFEVMAGEVTIEGFTIYDDATNPSDIQAGIFLASGTSHCTIANNRCGYDTTHNNGNGIVLDNSNNNTISGNISNSNYRQGIELLASNYNSISGNSCNFNYWGYGIELGNSDNNSLSSNICNSNYRPGIILFHSSNNKLSRNNCSLNDRGIALASSTGNTIVGNNCSENSEGIELRYSADNNILLNNVCNSNVNRGILFYQSCANNTISGNTFSENKYGLSLINSSDNTFYLNNFADNTNQNVGSGGSNNWYSPTKINYIYKDSLHTSCLGNFYSDHDLFDFDDDGVTDDPYVLGANEPDDEYPIIATSDNYSVVVLPSLEGDFDRDGDVDGADLAVFAENFGKTH